MAKLVQGYPIRIAASTTAQVLPENAAGIENVWLQNVPSSAGAAGEFLTAVTGAPGTTQIQFAGTVETPTTALTLNSAPATGLLLILDYLPAAGNLSGS